MALIKRVVDRLCGAVERSPFDQRFAASAFRGGVVIGGANLGFINTGTINGDVVFVQGEHYPLNLHIPYRRKGDVEDTDLNLLRWNSRLPRDLVGREEVMQAFLEWAATDTRLSMAVIEGPAGVGKTRLAFELADTLRQRGWEAGQVKEPGQPIAFEKSEAGCLLVIDYPEEQPDVLAKWLDGLQRAETPDFKLRVLLLCRRYSQLQSHENTLSSLCPLQLRPLVLPALVADEPWALFGRAYSSFALRRGLPPQLPIDQTQFSKWLKRDRNHHRPLLVQAYAINLLSDPDGKDRINDELVGQIVQRECIHFGRGLSALALDAYSHGAWLLKVLSAVTGGLSFSDLNHLHQSISPEALGGRILPTQAQWRSILGLQSEGLLPIQPDLFAAHALYSYPDTGNGEELLKVCMPTILTLGVEGSDNGQKLVERLERLTRLNWDRPSVRHEKIDPFIQSCESIVSIPNLVDFWRNYFSRNEFPRSMAPLIYRFRSDEVVRCEDLCARNGQEVSNELAIARMNLAVALSGIGESDRALEESSRAVETCRKLAKDGVAAHIDRLISSLSNHSNRFLERGDKSQALKAIKEAIEIGAKHEKKGLGSEVASRCYSVASKVFQALGGGPRWLAASRRSVVMANRLVLMEPSKFEALLASCLSDFSWALYCNGHNDDALDSIKKSVDILRRLAEGKLIVHGHEYSNALNILSICQSKADDMPGSMASAERTCEIGEELARRDFQSYGLNLAQNLNTYSNRLSMSGDAGGALEKINRSIEIYDEIMPGGVDFARALHNQANRLLENGREEDALVAINRSIGMRYKYWVVDWSYPWDLFLRAKCLTALKRYPLAMNAIEEAVSAVEPFLKLGGKFESLLAEMKSLRERINAET